MNLKKKKKAQHNKLTMLVAKSNFFQLWKCRVLIQCSNTPVLIPPSVRAAVGERKPNLPVFTVSGRAAKRLHWSAPRNIPCQNCIVDTTTEVWLAHAALQGTLSVLDEWAAATVQTNPPCLWKGCCTRVPIPVWRLQALKYPLAINNLVADKETARVFAFFYRFAVQSPTSHSASLQCSSYLSLYYMQIRYFGSQAKAWSQTA